MTTQKNRIILIAGPTASGKSALAAGLAGTLSGTVINADAMQVYRDLPILTAQPDAALKAGVPHKLYECIDPAEHFSAGKWLAQAKPAIETAWRNNIVPVLTGGTGMYFQSIIKGMADIADTSLQLHEELQKEIEYYGESLIRSRLAALDPEAAARIRPGDRQRLLRALEVVTATGKPLAEWQKAAPGGFLAQADIIPILLLPPRAELYTACDRRMDGMMQRGAREEVERLLARRLDAGLPSMKIIGVREIAAFLSGAQSLDAAINRAQQATRNYAKRQITWFKNQWLSNKIGFRRPVIFVDDFYRNDALSQIFELLR